MSDRDRDELALAIAHPKRSPTGMVTEPMPDECDRCVDALVVADQLLSDGWRKVTVTPEQVDSASDAAAEAGESQHRKCHQGCCWPLGIYVATEAAARAFGLVPEDGGQ